MRLQIKIIELTTLISSNFIPSLIIMLMTKANTTRHKTSITVNTVNRTGLALIFKEILYFGEHLCSTYPLTGILTLHISHSQPYRISLAL